MIGYIRTKTLVLELLQLLSFIRTWCYGKAEIDLFLLFLSTKAESEELSGQKIKPVPTKETSAIPKIKVATSSPKVERGPIKETYAAPKPKLPRSLACNLDQSTKAESEELWGQKIKPVPTTETSVIPKIKVATSSPKVEKGPIKETYAAPKPKLPRSLACILDMSQPASRRQIQESSRNQN
ncbi:unnamed protein product [Larinioides sclopetarius]|uniref:Uncharacterized protein n=1 Tax=Larinioides sclopetarius TaxID=280406 RepID=A0AAV2BZM5_9ARAC